MNRYWTDFLFVLAYFGGLGALLVGYVTLTLATLLLSLDQQTFISTETSILILIKIKRWASALLQFVAAIITLGAVLGALFGGCLSD